MEFEQRCITTEVSSILYWETSTIVQGEIIWAGQYQGKPDLYRKGGAGPEDFSNSSGHECFVIQIYSCPCQGNRATERENRVTMRMFPVVVFLSWYVSDTSFN